MQIVIDVNEHIYKQIMADSEVYVLDNEVDRILIENAIYAGTPLPKHHGRLIDADALWKKWVFDAIGKQEIDEAPTIIEADKGSDSE